MSDRGIFITWTALFTLFRILMNLLRSYDRPHNDFSVCSPKKKKNKIKQRKNYSVTNTSFFKDLHDVKNTLKLSLKKKKNYLEINKTAISLVLATV